MFWFNLWLHVWISRSYLSFSHKVDTNALESEHSPFLAWRKGNVCLFPVFSLPCDVLWYPLFVLPTDLIGPKWGNLGSLYNVLNMLYSWCSFIPIWPHFLLSMVAQSVKYLPAIQETRVQSLGWEDALEKKMASHSSILPGYSAWGCQGRTPNSH